VTVTFCDRQTMELGGLPNPHMNWESANLPDSWDKFERHCRLMFEGPLKGKKGKEQCAYILLWVGERGRTIHSSWRLTDDEAKHPNTIYLKFKEFVEPKSNPVFARYKFYNEKQSDDTIDEYVARLTISARNCDFGDRTDEMVRDRIVFGCASEKVRERLIEKGKDLTLELAVQIAQSSEYSKKQMAEMSCAEKDVDFVRKRDTRPTDQRTDRGRSDRGRARNRTARNPRRRADTSRYQEPETSLCFRCGRERHKTVYDCPAMGQMCNKCAKMNHFAKMCKSDTKNIHCVDDADASRDSRDPSEFYVYTVGDFTSQNNAVVKLTFGHQNQNKSIDAKIDTGSQVNILPSHLFERLELHDPLLPPDIKLTSYTGDQLSIQGKINLRCAYQNKHTRAEFYVVKQPHAPALLNLQTASDLGLIKLTFAVDKQTPLDKSNIMTEFPDVFQGIGTFAGTCHIQLKENAIPVVNPVRKVPIALRDKLKAELQSMESQGIISKVTEPTDWVNALVCVEKPKTGKLRICIDPKALNDAIKRPHYPMHDISDITSQLNGAKYFSVLDATKGYYSCVLSEESSLLTTFATPFGRFKWNRLAMGLRSSQDIFNRKMDEILEGLPGVASIVDDVICWGQTKSEHDENLRRLLTRAQEKGLKFNPEKLAVGQSEVKYFGHVISDKGMYVDQDKVTAISNMRTPESRHELETLLGMVTYLTSFAPNLAEVTSPMRMLLKQDTQFIWGPEQESSFAKAKQIISQAPVLRFFDPDKPVTLQVDASSKGIGCVALQEEKPIAYASKTLTKNQVAWAQIEKETAAILFACLKFKQYIYGKRTTVESDCKPVTAILKKPLSAAPQRLQKLIMQLQQFDIDVIHKKGTNIPIGDALSRNFIKDTYPELFSDMDIPVHTVKSLPISDNRIDQIREETMRDEQLQAVKRAILEGWPSERKSCHTHAIEFWNHRDELTYEDDLILRGSRIVIPKTLRNDMTEAVHANHMGCQKALNRSRDIMFWPGMTKQITDHVLACAVCEKYRDANRKEPLYPHEIPEMPWQNVSCDLFMFENEQYMVLADSFSHHIEVDFLPNISSKTVIRKLKVHFSRLGSPVTIKTDNGRQFTSDEFKQFASEWNFNHVTSSPNMPSSNGHAESAVKTVKRILRKAKDANTDPYMALLEFRNTPLPCGYSPAQLLMSRRLKSTLPTTNKQLAPEVIDRKTARESMQAARLKSKLYHDRNAKPLSQLNPGDRVTYQSGKVWEPAVVTSQYSPRSYVIRTPEGTQYRRNRIHLRKSSAGHQSTEVEQTLPCPSPPLAQIPRQHYVTRKGREVKPPKVYAESAWVR